MKKRKCIEEKSYIPLQMSPIFCCIMQWNLYIFSCSLKVQSHSPLLGEISWAKLILTGICAIGCKKIPYADFTDFQDGHLNSPHWPIESCLFESEFCVSWALYIAPLLTIHNWPFLSNVIAPYSKCVSYTFCEHEYFTASCELSPCFCCSMI